MIQILNVLFLLAAPFLFTGIINRIKAIAAGRKGAPLLQQYYDFFRLMKKSELISTSTSFIFKLAPAICLASTLFAGLFVPIFTHRPVLSLEGDFIIFAYLLAFGKFFSIIGSLDTASSFEGMGCSREVTFSALAEPGFFMVIASLAFLGQVTSLSSIIANSYINQELSGMIALLGAFALFILILVEGCRIPVDDPNTHLELTMIHEVMILDNSGPDLGFILYSNALKMLIFSSIITNLIIPPGLNILLSVFIFISLTGLIAVFTGIIESAIARLRMTHVPQFIFLITSVGLIVAACTILFNFGELR